MHTLLGQICALCKYDFLSGLMQLCSQGLKINQVIFKGQIMKDLKPKPVKVDLFSLLILSFRLMLISHCSHIHFYHYIITA